MQFKTLKNILKSKCAVFEREIFPEIEKKYLDICINNQSQPLIKVSYFAREFLPLVFTVCQYSIFVSSNEATLR